MAPATSALPFLLLLCLLAAASPTHSSLPPSSSPASSPLITASNPGLPEASDEKRSESSKWESGDERGEDGEEEKTLTASSEGVHKIQVREAGPARFWSGSRYGRSGRSAGNGISKSDSHRSHFPSSREMTMSLRSSNPVVQPRHDRFFLGSRYGKRSQGEAEEWRRGGEEEEVEEEEAVPEESEEEGGEMDATRMLEEAMHFRGVEESGKGAVTAQRGPSLEIQPVSCIYTGIGNLYRCYDGRREGTGVH